MQGYYGSTAVGFFTIPEPLRGRVLYGTTSRYIGLGFGIQQIHSIWSHYHDDGKIHWHISKGFSVLHLISRKFFFLRYGWRNQINISSSQQEHFRYMVYSHIPDTGSRIHIAHCYLSWHQERIRLAILSFWRLIGWVIAVNSKGVECATFCTSNKRMKSSHGCDGTVMS